MRHLAIFTFLIVCTLVACNDSASSSEEKTLKIDNGAMSTREVVDYVTGQEPAGLTRLFFLHHSTGSGVVDKGDVRGHVNAYNKTNGTGFEFWDHGYEKNGLFDQNGKSTGTNYGPLTNKTNPPDLHALWTSSDQGWTELRETILVEHEVISFKSCYPASNIGSASQLQQYKGWYLAMRDFFDTRQDRLFIVMSPPPLNPASTSSDKAKRARQFAAWLSSSEYLGGHPNVACFDLFDVLAQPDDGSTQANMLRADYRAGDNSHPTVPGYQAAGGALAMFFCEIAAAY